MLEVYFKLEKEAITFCERLDHYYNEHVQFNWETNEKWGNVIRIKESETVTQQTEIIVRALADVFINHRELNWINNIIKQSYYYQNKDEIQRIADLTQSIISGEDEDLGQIIKGNKPRDMLVTLFQLNKGDKAVHFDSIVNFRMQTFRNELIDLVGIAIDEFKQEEEYQLFVQSLREYTEKKESKYSIVHVLQGNDFTFYKSDGNPFTPGEVKMLIQREPLYIVGLDENEMNLTPLLAMAPKKIKIYGDHPSEAKTISIINIFQERVEFEPLCNFPFTDFLKS